MKKRYKFECPCGDTEITVTWFTDNEDDTVNFCPFCSANILDEEIELENYSDE